MTQKEQPDTASLTDRAIRFRKFVQDNIGRRVVIQNVHGHGPVGQIAAARDTDFFVLVTFSGKSWYRIQDYDDVRNVQVIEGTIEPVLAWMYRARHAFSKGNPYEHVSEEHSKQFVSAPLNYPA